MSTEQAWEASERVAEAIREARRFREHLDPCDLASAIATGWGGDIASLRYYLEAHLPYEERPARRKDRFLYLMQALPSGSLKIGVSVDPDARRKQHRTGMVQDESLTVLARWVDNSPGAESSLLAEIEAFGVQPLPGKKEWFPYNRSLVGLVASKVASFEAAPVEP